MINKFNIVSFVYTVTCFILIVAFLAKCASVPTICLIESYLAMKQFESRVLPFSTFFLLSGKEVCCPLLCLLSLNPKTCPSDEAERNPSCTGVRV